MKDLGLRERRRRFAWLWPAAVLVALQPLVAQTRHVPLPNPGFEEGEPGAPPPRWSGNARGGATEPPAAYRSVIDPDRPRQGKASLRLERVANPPEGAPPFGTVGNAIDASPYRGRRIRLTAAVRAGIPPADLIGLWLRVDRAQGRHGFFDNMSDRPIRRPDWADYVIEGDVAPDAERIAYGMLLAGAGSAWLDDVRLEDIGPAAPAPASAAGPAEILDRALDLLRSHHINSASADWDRLSAQARAKVAGATQASDAYDAIQSVIDALGERHTTLRPPPPPAEGAQAGRPVPPMPSYTLVDGRVGMVRLPGFLGTPEEARRYQAALRGGLASLDRHGVCGWIVDLRGNRGGNMWPMLNGLDPLLGEAPFGQFRAPSGSLTHWIRAGGEIRPGESATAEPPAFRLSSSDRPVAVLLGPDTASSGEMTAIAFAGRPRARSFGTRTAGFTTANQIFALPDDGLLVITTAYVRDRTGREYSGPMAPDEATRLDESPAAALRWLSKQPGC